MDSLSRRILSDPINKWVFSNTKKKVYLVGGYLRDLLLRHTSKDKDFVIEKDFEGTARRAAKRFKGTFIILKKNQTCRIALKNGEFIDFTPLQCPIEENLTQRDFTINAMAWSPERGIIDPFGGRESLKNKIIKAILPSNLADDPLRILRAYRIASEKGFIIEKDTTKYLRQYADGLSKVASERITEELFRILNHKYADKQLKDAYDNIVLEKIIITDRRRLRENLKLMTKYRIFINKIDKKSIHRLLKEKVGQGLTRDGLIKLAILITEEESEESTFKSISPSRAIKKGVTDIHKALKLLRDRSTDKRLYKVFKAANQNVIETALLLSVIKMSGSSRFLKRADDFIRISKNILLSGNEIQAILKASQGVIIGKILDLLQEQRFLKRLKTKAEARRWIISNFT
ncbi:MAG: CCA tRNA nucleotidyltransferase [Nitrospirae bacterium]|nr:CCA tRNA nucleotidyltransferase [Nitrospirota bacterium]